MLNPHTFPLLPYPGLAPELAVRSAMGDWPAYAQPVPADRLLPFVLSRAISTTNARWLNCARIEHADTGAVLFDLTPVGAAPAPANPLDLLLRKYTDAAQGVEHFIYMGGVIPGLVLPCGVPVRLVLDNDWQSPRLCALQDAGKFLLLEWWDNGPANGVPYGTGFRQRLYVENGALLLAEPTKQKETTKYADGSDDRLDALSLINNATFAVPPVPAYLAQAVQGMEAVANFEADGARWQVSEVKQTPEGADAGRWSLLATVKQKQVLKFKASCPAPALADAGYDPVADAPRPWRCGDATDTASDFQPTGAFACETDDDGNTGYSTLVTQDLNPNSATFGSTSTAPGGVDARCPLPPLYYSAKVSGFTARTDCPPGSAPASPTGVYYEVPAGAFTLRSGTPPADAQAAVNALAQAAYDADAQDHANANGACSVAGGGGTVSWQPVYAPSGCFACQMVNANDPGDVRDATGDEVLMYRVNAVFYQGALYECPGCF